MTGVVTGVGLSKFAYLSESRAYVLTVGLAQFILPLTPAPAVRPGNQGSAQNIPFVRLGLIQLIFLFELSGNVALGQVLKVLVGERVQLAGEPDEPGLGNGHSLTFESEIDRSLLDDRAHVVAPRIIVHEDI